MHDLTLLLIIWSCVFVASFMAHHTRLTPVLWYLFFGSLMVNIGLLPEEMPVFINDLSELAIIIIMFALGFEEDTDNFLASIKRSWGIALFGAITPFLVAYSIVFSLWHDNNMALLSGLAMMATAVSLTMVSLKSEGLGKTPAATGIMASAVLDAFASIAILSVLVPIAIEGTNITATGLLLIMAKALCFFLLVTLLGAWLFPPKLGWQGKIPVLGKMDLRKILAMGRGEYTVLALMLIAVGVALVADYFSLHPAVGAYIAGLIIKREYFDFHHDREIDFHKQAEGIINNVAYSWIGPIFFVSLGTELVLEKDLLVVVLPLSLLLFAGLFVGQILSAGLAARFTGKFSWSDSWMIGFGMLGRAELAFVVMEIAYLEHGVFSKQVFYTLMITCFMLNVSVPIMIRWWKYKFQKT